MNPKIDLTRLKWTKNINHPDSTKWAHTHSEVHYSSLVPELNLHWKKGSEANIEKPKTGDIILLRQRTRVTHLVMILDEVIGNNLNPDDPYPLFRHVQVLWLAKEPWDNAPYQDDVFGFDINLRHGKAVQLDHIEALTEEFKELGGLKAFQNRVVEKLGLKTAIN